MPPPGATQRSEQKFIVFENFEKMNTQSVRQALSEKELAWLENLQPIAGNNLTTVPGPSAALATLPETSQSEFYAAISGVDYLITFTTAGAAFATNLASGATNQFAPDGTFSQAPDLTVYQATRVLINDATAGYCTWDGTLFVRQGGVSPVITITNSGSGYSTAPAVTISGGSGIGATAHAVLSGGTVVAVILDSPGVGYQASDVLTVAFAGGVGAGATGHVTMSGFPVSSVTIASGGAFTGLGAGVFPLSFAGGGPSVIATANATVVSIGGGLFTVFSVAMVSGGSGYTSTPTCVLAGTGGGIQPSFNVFLGTEAVATIVLDAGGGAYGAAPAVTISGGGATTPATAHSTIAAGAVNALILDTAGAGYTSTPSVIIGTGTGAAASAHVWPFVPAGTTLAVFQGRVWLAGFQLLQWTGTKGYDDFNPANAAGSLNITDADLVHAITALRTYNNYLWIMGDQSVKQIGNISLNGAGTVTLFTILTLSSDQGTIYPRSCVSFNRVFMFANATGIWAVFGASVQKISDDMDGIWKLVDFSQAPQAALVEINAIHHVMYLVRYVDPISTTRSILLTFNGKKWFVISQGNSLKAIATTSTLASGKTSPYGSSGTDVTKLLSNSATAVAFRVQSSLTHHGNAVQRKKTVRQGFAVTAGGTGAITVSMDTDEGAQTVSKAVVSGFQTNSFANPNVSGTYLGMTISGTLAGFTLSAMRIEYQETNIGNKL